MESMRFPLKPQDPNIPCEESVLHQKIDAKSVVQFKHDVTETVSKFDIPYFRKCLVDERKRLTNLCDDWCEHLSKLGYVDDLEALTGEIRTVIGQARLVMAERFTQFEGLVDNCEFGNSEKPVTCIDLQGFWDMIYFQVQDVVDKFAVLEKRKENNWKADSKTVSKTKKFLKKTKARSPTDIAAAAARKEAAKKRLAAAKAALKKDTEPAITFDAGFFKVDSPAHKVVEKAKTPSSRIRKKTTTPKSSFLHGRYLTPKLSSTKKSLKFATPDAKKENNHGTAGKVVPKVTITEDNVASDYLPGEESACDKENIMPLTETKSPRRKSHRDEVTTNTIGVNTDPDKLSKFGSAIEIMFEQMKTISHVQEEFKEDRLIKMAEEIQALEEENNQLKVEIERLKESPVTNDDEGTKSSSTKDDLYEAHYKRVLRENEILKAQLSAFAEMGEELKKSEESWKETFELFFQKSDELEKFKNKLNERSEKLKEREQLENQEILRLTEANTLQTEELEKLNAQLLNYESTIKELEESRSTVAQLKEENTALKETCEMFREEKNKLQRKFAEQFDENENLRKNLQSICEEKKFEKEEFSVEKAFFEEEKSLLQSQLATTEATLQSTMDVLQKVKDKVMLSQTEADELRKNLEKAREDMVVLREETDITKVNSKLAILEQQQEVINSEAKLRQLLESMADFLLKLKKTNSDEVNCDDVPLLSDHPLKTPSKSLVVSALLRHDSDGNTSELSPEEKFDAKIEACLFALTNDVTSLMTNIMKEAAEVAQRYELEKKQLSADKSLLQSKVDNLKQEMTNRNQKENDVEISLRRRLHEVIEERNHLRQKHS